MSSSLAASRALPARPLAIVYLAFEVAPDRVGVFDLENTSGTPIYVHAKVCVVDDVWMTCGSDNFNRRSWTNDSELTCAVIDPTRDQREPLDLSADGDGRIASLGEIEDHLQP